MRIDNEPRYSMGGKRLPDKNANELIADLQFQLNQTETFARELRKQIDSLIQSPLIQLLEKGQPVPSGFPALKK